MMRKWQHVVVTAWALSSQTVWAQAPQFATLEIEWENAVNYFGDTADPTKFATSPTMVSPNTRNFMSGTAIADIVSVNGKPAKGSWVGRAQLVMLFPTPMPGQAIGDIGRPVVGDIYIEILQDNGTRVGTITGVGSPVGPAPPGSPAGFFGNLTVTGGTGAFVGARGFLTGPPYTFRAASIQEDPANRRTHGGGRGRYIVYLIPLSWPEIMSTAGRPAIVHASDSSLVTAAKPARSGELLTLFATGIGPTRPALEPGAVFTSDPLQVANSPVEVSVNGQAAEVLYAGGYPGSTDGFQVNFRMPMGVVPGMANLRLTAGFIQGRQVSIPTE